MLQRGDPPALQSADSARRRQNSRQARAASALADVAPPVAATACTRVPPPPAQLGIVMEWLGQPAKMQYQLVEATAAR